MRKKTFDYSKFIQDFEMFVLSKGTFMRNKKIIYLLFEINPTNNDYDQNPETFCYYVYVSSHMVLQAKVGTPKISMFKS